MTLTHTTSSTDATDYNGITSGSVAVSITDNDDPAVAGSLELATYTVGEGSSSTVKIKLSAGPVRSVPIPVMQMEQGGATFATYSRVPTSVALASGETENSITFSATADGANDDGESVKLTFGTLPAGVNPGSTAETVKSITDDDVPAVTVSFEQAAYTVAENDDPATAEIRENRATVKVKPSHDPECTVTILITKAGRGGETAADYSGIPENVTFDAWDTEKTFDFSATADSVDDDGESVKLDFGTMPTGVSASGTTETTVSKIDYDLPSVTVTFEEGSYTVPGGEHDDGQGATQPGPGTLRHHSDHQGGSGRGHRSRLLRRSGRPDLRCR